MKRKVKEIELKVVKPIPYVYGTFAKVGDVVKYDPKCAQVKNGNHGMTLIEIEKYTKKMPVLFRLRKILDSLNIYGGSWNG